MRRDPGSSWAPRGDQGAVWRGPGPGVSGGIHKALDAPGGGGDDELSLRRTEDHILMAIDNFHPPTQAYTVRCLSKRIGALGFWGPAGRPRLPREGTYEA